jgi:hypothetical protein
MLQALADWRDKGALAADGASALKRFITQADELSEPESPYLQCSTLVAIGLHLADWVQDVKGAQSDADRHYRAARHKLSEFDATIPPEGHEPIRTAAAELSAIREPIEVKQVAEILLRLDLPLPLVKHSERCGSTADSSSAQEVEVMPPCVAVVAFTLDGTSLVDCQAIQPHRIHDLNVSARLSRWPDTAENLIIEPITVEPASTYDMPVFAFNRPSGAPTYALNGTGRLVLRVPQTILSRPLEFSYRARFEPNVERVVVEGHRAVRIQSLDPRVAPLTGYYYIDQRLLQLRDQIRFNGGVPDDEIGWFLQVMMVLGRMAGEALQDHLFPGQPSEEEFQCEVRKRLRAEPSIGSQLEVHAHAGAGITDLSFKGIRIELKVTEEADVTPATSARFLGQTTQYTRSSDRRLGVLCVLDSSTKLAPPPEPADDIALESIQTRSGDSITMLGIVVVRGNMARPSDLSRRNSG